MLQSLGKRLALRKLHFPHDLCRIAPALFGQDDIFFPVMPGGNEGGIALLHQLAGNGVDRRFRDQPVLAYLLLAVRQTVVQRIEQGEGILFQFHFAGAEIICAVDLIDRAEEPQQVGELGVCVRSCVGKVLCHRDTS